MALDPTLLAMLVCPSCGAALAASDSQMACQNDSCGAHFTVVDDVPLLVDDRRSPIPAGRFAGSLVRGAAAAAAAPSVHDRIVALTPSIGRHEKRDAAIRRLVSATAASHGADPASVVVIGAGGPGPAPLAGAADTILKIVRIGVTPGPAKVDLACQADALPFPPGGVDAIVVLGALHGSLDVGRTVAGLLRVLRKDGLIYVEEPFMEPIQEGPYDFFRFSHLGLRSLFPGCEELDSGTVNGPGTALAFAWRHFLWSLPRSRRPGFLLATLGDFSAFFLKYIDRWLDRRSRALDSASSVFFLGQKGTSTLSARELVAGYRGASDGSPPHDPAVRPANEVFTEWAVAGRDMTMQQHHAAAVNEMLAVALAALDTRHGYTAIDAGCGNGWIVRMLRSSTGCLTATGVDGSAGMIAKARSSDPQGQYVIADLSTWKPDDRVDLVVSMEVLYYLQDPVALLRNMAVNWLKPGGVAVVGIDHYQENEPSLGWPKALRVHMTTWPEARWLTALDEAGFEVLRSWRAAAGPDEAGTLAMLAKARSTFRCTQDPGGRMPQAE